MWTRRKTVRSRSTMAASSSTRRTLIAWDANRRRPPMKRQYAIARWALILVLLTPSAFAQAVDRAQLAERVKAEFLFSWRAYEQRAWGHDELRPMSGTTRDWYGDSLLMTP